MTGHRSRAILKQMKRRRIGTPGQQNSSLLQLQTDGDVSLLHTLYTKAESCSHFQKTHPSVHPNVHSSIYVHPPPSALPCCSCVHYTVMPQLNKGLDSGDFGGVTGLNWAEIKCPWIERRNSQHRDFHHLPTLIHVYESCLKWSNIANTSRLRYKHIKVLHIDLASVCVFV